MITSAHALGGGETLRADLAVVGAGPAGIVVALEAASHGFDVLLLESGEEKVNRAAQDLAEAAEWDASLHSPLALTNRRQLGGTSVIWGGRCVPYDEVDFDRRAFLGDGEWPVTYQQLLPYFQRACDWLVCGRAVFEASEMKHLPASIVPGLTDGEVRVSTMERWSLPTNFGREYRAALRRSRRVRVVTGLTCTKVIWDSERQRAERLECHNLAGRRVSVDCRGYVLACGGLDTTRLLLASPGPSGRAPGDYSGHLGAYYIGHVEGVIANVRFTTPPKSTIFGYERDTDGTYVRRRFSISRDAQLERELPNVAAWLANPELADPRHRSGTLSFAYLALRSPLGRIAAPDAQRLALSGEDVPGSPYGGAEKGPIGAHLRNLVLDAGGTASFVAGFGSKRFLARHRRAPGFFVYNRDNLYPLQYHGEQAPNPKSRVRLATERDALGMPRLSIDLRFSQRDVDGVLRCHQVWDEYLRKRGLGRLEYTSREPEATVWSRIGGGFHQLGTTRMAGRPEGGVVNENLAVHGVRNLFVASSSAFVTAGQANPTFMIVAFGLRLADHLQRVLRDC